MGFGGASQCRKPSHILGGQKKKLVRHSHKFLSAILQHQPAEHTTAMEIDPATYPLLKMGRYHESQIPISNLVLAINS